MSDFVWAGVTHTFVILLKLSKEDANGNTAVEPPSAKGGSSSSSVKMSIASSLSTLASYNTGALRKEGGG